MRAVVLVGGEGTRLRPLTETTPKPLLPLMDRPFLHHVLDHLGRHGVTEVVLSSSYLESAFLPVIEERRGRPAVTWITEGEPLGTGGAIVNALEHLGDQPFFVLNGDILTDLDLTAMLGFHQERGAMATIALHPVEDARPFGLVETDAAGRVAAFREKPADPVPGTINAGTYLLDPRALEGFTADAPLSVERQVYPDVIARRMPVYGFVPGTGAYWLDLGTPEKYLRAHFDILEGRVGGLSYPAPWQAPGSDVDVRAHLGRWVVLGEGSSVAARAEVEDSVVHAGASVGEGAVVRGSILGPRSHVGDGARLEGSVLGEGARVVGGAHLVDDRVSAGHVAGEDEDEDDGGSEI